MIINKIVTNPEGFDRALDSQGRHLGPFINLNEEYVELKNEKTHQENISGWKILDLKNHEFIFPADTVVQPRATIILHSGQGTNTASDLYWNRKAPVWNNPGDTAFLYDLNGNLVSQKSGPEGHEGLTGTVSGYVYITGTTTGISDAMVSTEVSNNYAKTDASGHYTLTLASGLRILSASALGYNTSQPEGVTVRLNEDTPKNFYLSPGSGGAVSTVDVSIYAKNMPETVEWKKDYAINITFKNNALPINEFDANLYERTGNGEWVSRGNYSSGLSRNTSETWDVQFPISKKDWSWYSHDWAGYAQIGTTERTYEYKVRYMGRRTVGALSDENEENIGQVKVKVSSTKIDAVETYNNAHSTVIGGTAAAVVAGVGAAAVTFWEGPGAVITGLAVGAAVSGAIAGGAAIVESNAESTMNDPPQIDSKFSRICRPKIRLVRSKSKSRIKQNSINILNSLAKYRGYSDALRTTNNRLLTALLKNKVAAHKQAMTLDKNIKKMDESIKELKKFYKKLDKKLAGKFGLTAEGFKKAREHIATSGFPENITKQLKRYGISEEKLNKIKENVLHADSAKLELNLLHSFKKMINCLDKDNRAVKKEAKNYRKLIKIRNMGLLRKKLCLAGVIR
jgi:outer membrane lipoprotein SlyB